MSVFFKLHSNCILVKGINRSLIVDLQRNYYKIINQDLHDVLVKAEKSSIESIYIEFGELNKIVLDEYFDYVKDMGVFCTKEELKFYPKIDLRFESPNFISNCVIENVLDFGKIDKIFKDLDFLRCEYIDLIYYNVVDNDFLKKVLLKLKKSIIKHISLTLVYDDTKSLIYFKEICSQNPRILKISLHSSFKEENIKINNVFDLTYYKESLINFKNCGKVNSKYFTTNISHFSESQSHNTCLNRKIAIDKNGNIKNCPALPQSFGNIDDTTLEQALNHKDFKKYWNITKDQIEVCKDCEFRHICTDCRAYIEDSENQYSKPLKCGYNPYTNIWEDWSINPLKQNAIEYYGMQDLVKR